MAFLAQNRLTFSTYLHCPAHNPDWNLTENSRWSLEWSQKSFVCHPDRRREQFHWLVSHRSSIDCGIWQQITPHSQIPLGGTGFVQSGILGDRWFMTTNVGMAEHPRWQALRCVGAIESPAFVMIRAWSLARLRDDSRGGRRAPEHWRISLVRVWMRAWHSLMS
jgi:hypothetical protein